MKNQDYIVDAFYHTKEVKRHRLIGHLDEERLYYLLHKNYQYIRYFKPHQISENILKKYIKIAITKGDFFCPYLLYARIDMEEISESFLSFILTYAPYFSTVIKNISEELENTLANRIIFLFRYDDSKIESVLHDLKFTSSKKIIKDGMKIIKREKDIINVIL